VSSDTRRCRTSEVTSVTDVVLVCSIGSCSHLDVYEAEVDDISALRQLPKLK